MDIEGTYTLQASPEDVWKCLMDQQVLRRAIPGVEQLELIGENKYDITLHIKQTPLIGTYHGQATVTEQHYPYYYNIAIEGEGGPGTISGEGVVHLNCRDENTVVAYKGTLNIGKLGTLLPPPLVKGTAKLLLQQFFTALAEHLRTLPRPVSTIEVPEHNQESQESQERATLRQLEEQIAILAANAEPTKLLHTLVHELKLGGGDPILEEQWVNRIRRIGFVFGLLLLVWIGTRLPRRPGP
jgi:carbon monoxide dehydrogenase subunit G